MPRKVPPVRRRDQPDTDTKLRYRRVGEPVSFLDELHATILNAE